METKIGNDIKISPITIIRKIFSVYIHNKEYDVYSIDGKEHSGMNNTPKNWWLYFTLRLPEGSFPDINDKKLIPWDVGIERRLWEIEIKQTNTHKIKWDDDRFSNHITVDMICNKKKIYSFGTFDMGFALSKLQYLQVVLSEHPYNFFEPEKEKGRKIYWWGLPATVSPKNSYPGEIAIIPEYSDELPKKEWWDEYERRTTTYLPKKYKDKWEKEDDEIFSLVNEENRYSDYINWGDALSDGNIDWFRE